MERRTFIGTSAAAALSPAGRANGTTAETEPGPSRPLLFELRRYRVRTGVMASRFNGYVKEALLPALGRAGVGPVGVFNVSLGADSPTLHVLVPHANGESVATLGDRLDGDAEYRKAAAELLALPSGDPPYLRCDSSLHTGVPTLPGIAKLPPAVAVPSRIFELRTYRSHSEPASRKKIDMFEAKGELAIFARDGMHTVFFSRDLVGEGLPSLTYMLAFADAAAREKAWGVFRDDPEWAKLRALPGYADAEVVCGISAALLRPTEYSQI
jgi:hypothetical protein